MMEVILDSFSGIKGGSAIGGSTFGFVHLNSFFKTTVVTVGCVVLDSNSGIKGGNAIGGSAMGFVRLDSYKINTSAVVVVE